MAFCPECGKEIQKGIRFCNQCGAQLIGEAATSSVQYASEEMREKRKIFNVKIEAKKVYDYFMAKRELFDELVNLTVEKNNSRVPRRLYALWLFPIWGVAFMLDKGGATATIGFILEAFFILMFITGIFRRKKKCNRLDDRLVEIDIRSTEICNEIADYYDAYGDCPIGIDYIWPEDLSYLTECIFSGRADSFKEALNLLHHKWEVEEQNEKLEIIQRNSELAVNEASEANRKAGFAAHCAAWTLYAVTRED